MADDLGRKILEDAAIDTVMQEKFGLLRHMVTERQLAEAIGRLPDRVIQGKIDELWGQIEWLKGWLRGPPPPSDQSGGMA